jgi:DNA-binding NtrC family response regulator
MKDRFEELVKYLMSNGLFLEEAVELLERTLIERALAETEGNQSAASKMLGIHRNTLQRKMVEFQLDGRRPKPKPVVRAMARATRKRKAS